MWAVGGACFVLLVLSFSSINAAPITLQQVFTFVDTYHPDTPLYDGLGDCVFPVTSSGGGSDELQKYANMGICMLHTFWPSEAIRAFRRVVKIDPTCAIGYWGLAQALSWDVAYENAKNDAKLLASKYYPLTSKREQLYIDSLFAKDTAQYNAIFQQIFAGFPWDNNAKSFWAWQTIADSINYMGFPFPARVQAQQLLANQTKYFPRDVGYQHYTIHAWEDTFYPYKTIDACKLLATISPNAGHNVHMPGHIYYLMNDHDRAHNYFLQGVQVDENAMATFGVNFMEYWEYIHNLAYLVGNLGEGGRVTEAIKYGAKLRDLYVNPSQPMILPWDPSVCRASARYYFQGLVALPFLYFQYSDWERAYNSLLAIENLLQPLQGGPTGWLINYYNALRQYSCVMRAYQTKDKTQAPQCLAALRSQYVYLDPFMNRTTENGFQVGKRSYIALNVCLAEATGALSALNLDYGRALNQLSDANFSEARIPYNEPPVYTRPVLATYADVLYDLYGSTGNTAYLKRALGIYQQIIHSPWHNNSGFGLFGIGYTNAQLNNVTGALEAFNYMVDISWKSADRSLPQMQYAINYIQTHTSPANILCVSYILMLALLLMLVG